MNFAFKIDILSPINAKLMKNAVKLNTRAHGSFALRQFLFSFKKLSFSADEGVIYQRCASRMSDKTENLIEKRYGAVSAFDTIMMIFYRLFSTICVHVAVRPRRCTYSVDML